MVLNDYLSDRLFGTATRYNGMIHDFVLLNATHEVPEVQAAIRQAATKFVLH